MNLPLRPDGGGTVSERLEGVLQRVVYSSEETAWTVVRLSVEGRSEPVT